MFKYFLRGLILSILVFAGLVTLSQSVGEGKGIKIKGTIVDSLTNTPIQKATISLKAASDKSAVLTLADSLGNFTIGTSVKGPFVIQFSSIGYKDIVMNFPSSSVNTMLDLGSIKMVQDARLMGAVIVNAKKQLIHRKDDKLIYNAADDITNNAGSAADVLRKAPMVTVDAQGDVRMRGSANIKVLLNGLPSGILAKNLKEALKMIPAASIQSIEVITSPSAKYEAEGAAGVINIVTRKKMRGTNGSIDLSAGNLSQGIDGGLNVVRGKFNFFLQGGGMWDRQRTMLQLKRRSFFDGSNAGDLLQHSDAEQKKAGGYGELTTEYNIDSSQKIGTSISYFGGNWPVKTSLYNAYSSVQNTTTYNQQSTQSGMFKSLDMSLNYSKKFRRTGQQLQLLTQYSNSKEVSNYFTEQYSIGGKRISREQGPNNGGSKQWDMQVDYAHPLNKSGRNLLEFGGRYSKTQSNSSFRVLNDRNDPGGEQLVEDPSRADAMNYYQKVFAGYLTAKFTYKNGWGFRPGLRYEYTRLGADFKTQAPSFAANFGNLVPSIQVSKKLSGFVDLKFNYTERIRRPWIWDLNPYVNASDPRNLTFGNPKLRPEVTRMLEVGSTYTGSITLMSNLYFHSNSNAIEPLTTVDSEGISRTTSQNIASNKRLGLNLNTYVQLNENWLLNGGAELYHVWFKSPALNVSNDASFVAVNLNSSYTIGRDYTVAVFGDFSNGFITLQGRNSANYSYGLSGSKEIFKKHASITVSASNPFQKTFRQRSFITAPTFQSNSYSHIYNRAFSVAFSWRFGKVGHKAADEKRFSDQRDNRMPQRKSRN